MDVGEERMFSTERPERLLEFLSDLSVFPHHHKLLVTRFEQGNIGIQNRGLLGSAEEGIVELAELDTCYLWLNSLSNDLWEVVHEAEHAEDLVSVGRDIMAVERVMEMLKEYEDPREEPKDDPPNPS